MIITCEECQARFRLADEKIKPDGTKVRCSKCRHVFTVLPPEPESAEEAVDFGAFNMEPVTEETAPAVVATSPEPAATTAAPTPADAAMDLDFSSLEQSMGPDAGEGEFAEEFSFADTSAPADGLPDTATAPAEPAIAFGELDLGDVDAAGGLDFDATFAENEEPPSTPPGAGPTEAAFDVEVSTPPESGISADTAAFDFPAEPPLPASSGFETEETVAASAFGEFALEMEPAPEEFHILDEPTSELSAFGPETDTVEASPAFLQETAEPEKTDSFAFGSEDGFESSPFDRAPALGEDGTTAWDQTEMNSSTSFDFDEPNFETKADDLAVKRRDEAGMSFGEIDFPKEAAGAASGFGAEPDVSRTTMNRPAETEPHQPYPSSRPTPSRPRSEALLPTPTVSRNTPMSRVVLLLVLILLALCGAGGYFYFMEDGRKIVENLLMKVKGEVPVAPVEQRIGLKIFGSSYVDNRDVGQLLVIQGSATNNFAGARSAITVKGLLLDAGGKILQQQTVFCGNYLGDEKLRTMKYAQIEEAMNNQFGDSLANMNVKPGVELRFTIVFRNLPKDLANINVEVVDSKPGGL